MMHWLFGFRLWDSLVRWPTGGKGSFGSPIVENIVRALRAAGVSDEKLGAYTRFLQPMPPRTSVLAIDAVARSLMTRKCKALSLGTFAFLCEFESARRVTRVLECLQSPMARMPLLDDLITRSMRLAAGFSNQAGVVYHARDSAATLQEVCTADIMFGKYHDPMTRFRREVISACMSNDVHAINQSTSFPRAIDTGQESRT